MLGQLCGFQGGLLGWYSAGHRDLPWRTAPNSPSGSTPDPYHVLVSEVMLQQTQVDTVVSYFLRFIERLPTISDLAAADEREVLRLWQGLGYYSRVRNLQASAKIIVNRYSGRLPSSVEELLGLPGIGRYTAGAIVSLAFDQRAPILDGNVARVLCRIDAIEDDPRASLTRRKLWERAEQILPAERVGEFNSALMELGATVCTPRDPKCEACPVARHCGALRRGIQERVPMPARARPRAMERRWVLCIQNRKRYLIEQRPANGRWASMWQFATVPAGQKAPSVGMVRRELGMSVRTSRLVGSFHHDLTHRRYQFDVYRCTAQSTPREVAPRRWVSLEQLSDYPLPLPHQKIAALLRKGG